MDGIVCVGTKMVILHPFIHCYVTVHISSIMCTRDKTLWWPVMEQSNRPKSGPTGSDRVRTSLKPWIVLEYPWTVLWYASKTGNESLLWLFDCLSGCLSDCLSGCLSSTQGQIKVSLTGPERNILSLESFVSSTWNPSHPCPCPCFISLSFSGKYYVFS